MQGLVEWVPTNGSFDASDRRASESAVIPNPPVEPQQGAAAANRDSPSRDRRSNTFFRKDGSWYDACKPSYLPAGRPHRPVCDAAGCNQSYVRERTQLAVDGCIPYFAGSFTTLSTEGGVRPDVYVGFGYSGPWFVRPVYGPPASCRAGRP